MGGRTAAGLADSHTDAIEQQRREARRAAAQRRHHAPKHEADGDHALARETVREARDRNSERRVKKPEGGAGEQTELEIREPEVLLD